MKTFAYKGYDATGRASQGLIEALDLKEAREKLQARGVLPERVASVEGTAGGRASQRRATFSLDQRAMCYHELASLLQSGLPLVQAMQSGCPVVYSQESCLDEIMDSNGLKFNPHSKKDLEKVLKEFWNNENIRQKYAKLGLIRAKDFSWQQTALQTLALYNLTLLDEK